MEAKIVYNLDMKSFKNPFYIQHGITKRNNYFGGKKDEKWKKGY